MMVRGWLFEATSGISRFIAQAGDDFIVGRAPPVAPRNIRVRSRTVGRTHAHVVHGSDRCTIEDAGSPSGIYVNGESLRGSHEVASGDRILLTSDASFVTRPFSGESLWDRLRGEPLPLGEALAMTRDVLVQLGDLHQADVEHGDLTPHDILLEAGGTVVLIVRGWSAIGADGALTGNPAYVAPEAFTEQKLGPSSDVYSLGLVLYEALTGRRPFPIDPPHVGIAAKLAGGPPALDPSWSSSLSLLVAEMLARSAAERPRRRRALTLVQASLEEAGLVATPLTWSLEVEGVPWATLEWRAGVEIVVGVASPRGTADQAAWIRQRFLEFTGHREIVTPHEVEEFVTILLPHDLPGVSGRRVGRSAASERR